MNSRIKTTKNRMVLLLLAAMTISFSLAVANDKGPATNKQSAVVTKLKALEGYYQWQEHKGMFVNIAVKDGKLVLKQLWDNKEMVFDRNDDLDFTSAGVFPIKFVKDKGGKVVQMVALNKDVWDLVNHYPPKQ